LFTVALVGTPLRGKSLSHEGEPCRGSPDPFGKPSVPVLSTTGKVHHYLGPVLRSSGASNCEAAASAWLKADLAKALDELGR
jgi:hypothetical protein